MDQTTIKESVRLIAIPPSNTPNDVLLDACLAAERGGATAVQLRMKQIPSGDLLGLTDRLVSTLTIPVYVNDRADVARLGGAAGAHIGAHDLSPATIRKVLPRPFALGVSVGDSHEAKMALVADADYWSIGPFRATPTKTDAGPALGVVGFQQLASLCPSSVPVIAIGGISVDNVVEVMRAGAHGVAVITAIFGQPDIEVATRQLREALETA